MYLFVKSKAREHLMLAPSAPDSTACCRLSRAAAVPILFIEKGNPAERCSFFPSTAPCCRDGLELALESFDLTYGSIHITSFECSTVKTHSWRYSYTTRAHAS